MTEDIAFVYVTVPDPVTAERIAAELLDRRLVACVNILSPHRALYRWEGRIADESEIAMILKTGAMLAPDLVREIAVLHPYDTPCILALPVIAAHGPFARWISDQTQGGG